MGLMLGLGVAGKTVWDVVSAPAPLPEARSEAPLQLAPLPSPQPPPRKLPAKAKAKPVRTGRRVAAPAPKVEEPAPTPAPAPAVASAPEAAPAPAPAPAPEVSAEPELSPPPLEEAPVALEDGNAGSIARAIASAKRRAVQACFERELKRSPNLEGRVTVELELAPPQRVEAVRVSDDLGRPEFTQCVQATMQHLAFTGLDEEVTVQLPYLLSPRRK